MMPHESPLPFSYRMPSQIPFRFKKLGCTPLCENKTKGNLFFNFIIEMHMQGDATMFFFKFCIGHALLVLKQKWGVHCLCFNTALLFQCKCNTKNMSKKCNLHLKKSPRGLRDTMTQINDATSLYYGHDEVKLVVML